MRTTTIRAKLAGMRAEQEFTVYPRNRGDAQLVVQSDRAIGQFDPTTGEGVLNWRGSKAKYFHHLATSLGAEPYTFPPDFVSQAVMNEPKQGAEVGPSVYVL